MKAAIYIRISSDSQEDGTSLETQKESCLAKARELGYDNPTVYREIYSGMTLDRPMLCQLRDSVINGEIDTIICYNMYRLPRDPEDRVILRCEFRKAGAKLILVTETLEDSDEAKLVQYIQGYSAKIEAKMIRERCLRGLKQRAKSGMLVGGRAVHLFGFDYDKSQGKRLINEEQAQVARNIFNWLAEGSTINGIRNRLTELGILSPTGKHRWNSSTVHKILANKAYVGQSKAYHGIEIADSTPALISKELFAQVQTSLRNNAKMASRNAKSKFLLRGHIYCSSCHRKYYACKMHRTTPYYYCCGRLRQVTSNHCDNKTYQGDYLETLVWQKIEELLTSPEVITGGLERRKHETNQLDLANEIGSIEKRLINLDKEQEELLAWALKGFPEETVIRENAKINLYRDNLKSRLSELSARMSEAKQNEFDLVGLKHFCELARHNIKNFGYGEKRLALEALRIEVWIDSENISMTGAVPTCDIATTRLKPGHREWLSLYYHKSLGRA